MRQIPSHYCPTKVDFYTQENNSDEQYHEIDITTVDYSVANNCKSTRYQLTRPMKIHMYTRGLLYPRLKLKKNYLNDQTKQFYIGKSFSMNRIS